MAVILATPEPLVIAVGEDKFALAPLAGAVKLTIAPPRGIPLFSTVTWSGKANGFPMGADCH